MRRVLSVVSLCAAMVVAGAGVASAGPITWTDWTAAVGGAPGTAAGTVAGHTVAYVGDVTNTTQIAGGTNYWNPDTPYLSATVDNAPPCCDIITLSNENITNTLTFTAPLLNPIMAIVSLGQPLTSSGPVRYHFDQGFNVLSSGPGYWGGPGTLTDIGGNVLEGIEGHGAIQFSGLVSSISWTAEPYEYWHGFTIGVSAVTPNPQSVPDAASTVGLFGIAAAGLMALRRRINQ